MKTTVKTAQKCVSVTRGTGFIDNVTAWVLSCKEPLNNCFCVYNTAHVCEHMYI